MLRGLGSLDAPSSARLMSRSAISGKWRRLRMRTAFWKICRI